MMPGSHSDTSVPFSCGISLYSLHVELCLKANPLDAVGQAVTGLAVCASL